MHRPRPVAVNVALVAAVVLTGCGAQRSQHAESTHRAGSKPAAERSDRAAIGDVIRRFNRASLAADGGAQCALIDPATLRYLEQIDEPCEILQGGTLTPASARDVRSRKITSITMTSDAAVAQTDGLGGPRDITMYCIAGRWYIRGP
jgi:hypothetical protein